MDLSKVQHSPDTSFLSAIKKHSPDLLEMLYIKYYKNLEVYIIQNSGSEEDAKDIYQEGFLAVWRNIQLEKFNPNTEDEFAAYLIRVCKNKWIDQLRKNKTRQFDQSKEPDTLTTIIEEDVQEKYIDEVIHHFQKLGEKCRNILNMYYYKKKSMKEISLILKITEASAKNNKYRCLQKLREMVLNEKK